MSLSLDVKKSFPAFTLEAALEVGTETLGFLGASGCGKSLTMRLIAGLETPDEGRIIVNGVTFFDSAAKVNLSPQERKTAMLFQDYMLFPNLTVAQNIAAGFPKSRSKEERKAAVKAQLRLFGLQGFGGRYPARLSGGQQQRVALARMLVAQPGILMLDEPFSALDTHLKSALEQELLDLFEAFEGTVLYVSHDIDEVCRFCDRIAVIDHGRVAEVASTERIISHPGTYATLKVSGVNNISPACYVDDHTIKTPAWGLPLKTAQTVPGDVAYVGIRAYSLRKAQPCDDNAFLLEVSRVSDSRFESIVTLRIPKTDSCLQWMISRITGDNGADIRKDLIRGNQVWVSIPPDAIYLV